MEGLLHTTVSQGDFCSCDWGGRVAQVTVCQPGCPCDLGQGFKCVGQGHAWHAMQWGCNPNCLYIRLATLLVAVLLKAGFPSAFYSGCSVNHPGRWVCMQ